MILSQIDRGDNQKTSDFKSKRKLKMEPGAGPYDLGMPRYLGLDRPNFDLIAAGVVDPENHGCRASVGFPCDLRRPDEKTDRLMLVCDGVLYFGISKKNIEISN